MERGPQKETIYSTMYYHSLWFSNGNGVHVHVEQTLWFPYVTNNCYSTFWSKFQTVAYNLRIIYEWKMVIIYLLWEREREREREAYNCVIWQVVTLQTHLIAGLFLVSSKSIPSSMADPLHGSPVMFHNDAACASHCWNIEFNAFTVSQVTTSQHYHINHMTKI